MRPGDRAAQMRSVPEAPKFWMVTVQAPTPNGSGSQAGKGYVDGTHGNSL